MKDANYAPIYCVLYPKLAEITRKHGYALAVHGTLGKDMDLICVPWVQSPSSSDIVVKEIISNFTLKQIGDPAVGLHGRLIYTLSLTFGECYLDLSFMPVKVSKENK